MRTRSAVILIEDDKLALMERHRAGKHYFSFPGGGIEKGEAPQQTAVREAQEELGVLVEVKQKVAELTFKGNKQIYFLVEKISGEFGTGTGEEFSGYNPEHGAYHPLWMPLAELSNHNVLPRVLAELVVRCLKEGWPAEPVIIIEEE